MSTETKARYFPSTLRKRFDKTLERCARHGDEEGNDAEIGDLQEFCELLFTHGSLFSGLERAIDEMNDRLKEAGIR